MQISDQQQREQVLDHTKSFIVQAPAGSGKTTLLIQRFLTLLANACNQPEEIIAITFTRKAAEEMRTRILQTLQQAKTTSQPQEPYAIKNWQLANKVLRRDQNANWQLLQNPNRLQIFTIDSLCSKLTHQLPLLSGFSSHPEIVQDQEAWSCYHQAAHNLLSEIEQESPLSQPLCQLLLHLDNNYQQAETLIAQMLAKRDQWLPHLNNNVNSSTLRQQLEQTLANITLEAIDACKNSLPQQLTAQLLQLLPYNQSEVNTWKQLANLLLTKNGQWRKRIDKKQLQDYTVNSAANELKQLLTELYNYPQATDKLAQIYRAPPAEYLPGQWQILTNIIKILTTAVAYLTVIFSESNIADYSEIAMAAERALRTNETPTDLALKLDYRIKHLLVDEFQDTSVMQYRLIEKLTLEWLPNNGRTLFLVGDPMQSIYKFRQAQVGLFVKAKQQGINNIKLISVILHSNFRSEDSLISWFNHNFPTIMPQFADISSGAIPYSPSTSVFAKDGKQRVFNYLAHAKDRPNEAQQIVNLIQELNRNQPQASVAILVRYRTHLLEIIPALQQAGINFIAEDLELLANSSVVNDLLSLTKALNDLNDRVAWLSILRAPWCGLTITDLQLVAQHNPELPLWHTINSANQLALSNDGKQRLDFFHSIIAPQLAKSGKSKLASLIEETWLALNGLSCVTSDNELEQAHCYLELLNNYDQAGAIENIADLETKLTTLYTSNNHSNSNLAIMTMHKAKGLEFDHVIIPGLDRSSRNDDAPLLIWMERAIAGTADSELLLAAIDANKNTKEPIYSYLAGEDRRKNRYELARLLYVACTRAKKSLHLLACAVEKKSQNSLLSLLDAAFSNAIAIKQQRQQIAVPEIPKLQRLPLSAIPESEPVTNEITITAEERPTPSLSIASNNSQKIVVGIIVHKYLKLLSEMPANNWNQLDWSQLRDSWRLELKQQGIFADSITALNTIETALKNTLTDVQGRWILDNNHLDTHSEYEITVVHNNVPKQLIIDRTFIANNIRWIIDYKTSCPKQTSLETFIEIEKQQYQSQLQGYAQALKNLEQRRIQTALYFPLLSRLVKLNHM